MWLRRLIKDCTFYKGWGSLACHHQSSAASTGVHLHWTAQTETAAGSKGSSENHKDRPSLIAGHLRSANLQLGLQCHREPTHPSPTNSSTSWSPAGGSWSIGKKNPSRLRNSMYPQVISVINRCHLLPLPSLTSPQTWHWQYLWTNCIWHTILYVYFRYVSTVICVSVCVWVREGYYIILSLYYDLVFYIFIS